MPYSINFASLGVIVFFLGFFLDFLEITLIVLPVFTPLIVQMDFGDHLAHADIKFWFIILLAVNLQTSFLTPPFGFALFYMKGIAPREIKIYREEVYQNIVAENREAAMANPEALDVVVSDLAPPDSDAPEEPERTPTTTRPSNGDQPHPDKGKKPRG